jgi:hypothetical protein
MFVGFLGSQPQKGRRRLARRLKFLVRAAISVAVGGAILVFGLAETFVWLQTGNWRGYRLLALAESLAGGPMLSRPSGPEPWYTLQETLHRLMEGMPVSMVFLGVGAWIAWRAFPRIDDAPPPGGLATIDRIRAEVRQIRGDGLVIVSRQRPRLFEYLEQQFRGDPGVQVIFDRRWGKNRYRAAGRERERRRHDRRRRPDSTEALLSPPYVLVVPREPVSRPEVEQGRPDETR